MLQSNHENVILDASGTNDQMIALAVALSDVVLTPFCLDEPNYEAFLHAIDLVRIVTANMRRGLNQWVYLTTRSESASTVVMVQVSGQLAMKGLGTLTVPLCGCNEGESECLKRAGAADEHNHLVFANGVFDLIARRFAPIIRQRRFG